MSSSLALAITSPVSVSTIALANTFPCAYSSGDVKCVQTGLLHLEGYVARVIRRPDSTTSLPFLSFYIEHRGLTAKPLWYQFESKTFLIRQRKRIYVEKGIKNFPVRKSQRPQKYRSRELTDVDLYARRQGSFASNSKSSHEPRYGITRAENKSFPEECVFPRSCSKKTPGERCSCDTITRSVPLMMKVPVSVMSGISPI